jgi:hypothetical protein
MAIAPSADELPGEQTTKNEEGLKSLARSIASRLLETKCQTTDCGHVLVVDDNEFNRYLLVQVLTKYGFVCQTV